MKMKRTILLLLIYPTLSLAILLTAASVYAQAPTRSMLSDPRMVVIPERGAAEIAIDMDNAKANKQLALNRKAQAEGRLREIELSLEDKDASLDDVNRRKDDAKDSEGNSEKVSLEIESKANKQTIDLLKRLKDLRKTEIEEADAEAKQADIAIRVFQMESELQTKRTAYRSQSTEGVGSMTQNTAQQVLRELEVRLLKLQEDQASATEKVASKQKDVVSRRMKLHEAQLKLGIPRM